MDSNGIQSIHSYGHFSFFSFFALDPIDCSFWLHFLLSFLPKGYNCPIQFFFFFFNLLLIKKLYATCCQLAFREIVSLSLSNAVASVVIASSVFSNEFISFAGMSKHFLIWVMTIWNHLKLYLINISFNSFLCLRAAWFVHRNDSHDKLLRHHNSLGRVGLSYAEAVAEVLLLWQPALCALERRITLA